LSMHNDIRFVAEMINSGASGYVLKDSVFDELIHAIGVVAGQGTYLSPKITIPGEGPLPAHVL
jgi:DNA-binding NarL/FixJ family response regulator